MASRGDEWLTVDRVDLRQTGLRMFLSQPAIDVLDYLWDVGAFKRWPRSVKDIYAAIGEKNECSRTTVNNLLQNMVKMGLLFDEDRIGKGGIKWMYWPKYVTRQILTEQLVKTAVGELNSTLAIEGSELRYYVLEPNQGIVTSNPERGVH